VTSCEPGAPGPWDGGLDVSGRKAPGRVAADPDAPSLRAGPRSSRTLPIGITRVNRAMLPPANQPRLSPSSGARSRSARLGGGSSSSARLSPRIEAQRAGWELGGSPSSSPWGDWAAPELDEAGAAELPRVGAFDGAVDWARGGETGARVRKLERSADGISEGCHRNWGPEVAGPPERIQVRGLA
jgi:hypothetical protein